MRKWRTEDSAELYNIEGWGIGYFGVNKAGNVTVMPHRNPKVSVDIKDILDELSLKDVSCPVLLRFPDILDNRIETISNCFKNASEEYNFSGNYYTVYPIKVNQQRPVVEEIVQYGQKFNIGLEAGSKPELHAVLAIMDNPDALLICNGYKDEEFIELALLAQKMGKRIFIVAEKFNELKLIVKLSKVHKVNPNIGIRIKLAAFGSGKWEDSGGDKSKFGLTPTELIDAVEFMKSEDLLDCVKLIHCHLGSQITNIRKIKRGLKEASQFYVQLRKLGCNLEYVDIGGGLGVDYDGTRTTISSSINYSIQEYANDAVSALQDAADKNNFPHPHLITESGRALTAHHSVLVFNVLETTCPPRTPYEEFKIDKKDHEIVVDMHTILDSLTDLTMIEAWHDAQQLREESLDLFNLGMLDLKSRAKAEKLFWAIAHEVRELAQQAKHTSDEIRQLDKILAEKYFCNFSLFQSLPDAWAVDQLFPIMPLHRLQENPDRRVTMQDLTCDSDGTVSNYVESGRLETTLALHSLQKGQPYLLGIFMVGAYQEILGDLHNLFGDTDSINVELLPDGRYQLSEPERGDTIDELLRYVHFEPKDLLAQCRRKLAAAVENPERQKMLLREIEAGLIGYTYLED